MRKRCHFSHSYLVIVVCVIAGIISYGATGDKPADHAAFRVTKATLRVNPVEYNGPCPAEIKFQVRISATGKGLVICKILRSDQLPGPTFDISFEHSGKKDTSYVWQVEENFMGWQQLEIVQPNSIKSNKAEFAVMCQQ